MKGSNVIVFGVKEEVGKGMFRIWKGGGEVVELREEFLKGLVEVFEVSVEEELIDVEKEGVDGR